MPIILITAITDSKDVVAGLEAGGDEYLTKPVDHAALVARVKSMLRIKKLHDTVLEQSTQLKKQLKTATKIQSLFWPEIPEIESGGHIWAVSVPANYVGGDLYDVIPLTDGSLLAYVADVSDKGVPAALIMAALSTKIKSDSRVYSEIIELVESINLSMYSLISGEGFFATIALVKFWPATGKMELSLGGHFQPLWIVADGLKKMPQIKGISLGITPDAHFEKGMITLSPGESILLYTDGLIEAENEDKELFGKNRLIQYVIDNKSTHIGEGLLEEIKKWRGKAAISDDLTLLEIWRDKV
jgi:serine phosphatase RsbU (regulator of sigma subunit)